MTKQLTKEQQQEKVIFRGNEDNLITLTIGELNDLVYSASLRAARKATNDLYHGITKGFFYRWDDDIRTILDEIEQLKLRQYKGDNADE